MAKSKPEKENNTQLSTDEPSDLIGKITAFFNRYRDFMSYVGIGVVVVGAVIMLVTMNNRAKEEEASGKFRNAIQIYKNAFSSDVAQSQEPAEPETNPKTLANAIDALKEVTDNFPSTSASDNSQYLIGTALLNDGQSEEAQKTLENFIAGNTTNPLVPSALLAISTAQANMGKHSESLTTLQKIETQYADFQLKDVLKYEMAKRHEAMEQWEKARQLYKEVMDQFPDSSWKGYSQKRLQSLDRNHPAPKEEPSA